MNQSYVIVPAAKALEMAESTLKWIYEARQKRYDEYIDERLAEINLKRSKKWFGDKTPVTRDEVIYLEERLADRAESSWEFLSEVRFIRVSYGRTEELAKKVLLAVKVGDPIYLTFEDVERLS